jgi:mannose-1-phosphate guanylyltransferase/mannose-6-phosphate isomerase
MMIVPVILAGGFGTRLWPISSRQVPKQFANLVGNQTLFQYTLSRLNGLSQLSLPIIVCNENHCDLVDKQLANIGINEAELIFEPFGRNTAPAIAIAAFRLLAQNSDALMLILPADHVINNIDKFHEAILLAKNYAERNFLVCFGVEPDRPETGYGYIEVGNEIAGARIYNISKFKEKPNLELAKKYISTGKYYWNSGMFMFRASIYLQELKQNHPDIYVICQDIVEHSEESHNKIFKIDAEKFNNCPSISIDYAVMEKTKKALVVPFNAGWSDLGSWRSLWEYKEKDQAGNVFIGDVEAKNINNSYVHATKRKIVVSDMNNCVVVENDEVVFIGAKEIN